MKPFFFILCLLFSSSTVFSHTQKEDFDYSIVFGGCFEKDIVSLKINNTSIFDHYKVENENALKKGNLSLTQSNKKIHLFYNGQQRLKRKVNFSFYLDIDVTVNNRKNNFKVDLRKGKVILFQFCPPQDAKQNEKKLTVEQLQEQVILM
jgi:hypothetical protein